MLGLLAINGMHSLLTCQDFSEQMNTYAHIYLSKIMLNILTIKFIFLLLKFKIKNYIFYVAFYYDYILYISIYLLYDSLVLQTDKDSVS